MKTTQDLHGLQITELPSVFTRSKFSGGSLTRTFKGTEAQIVNKEDEMVNLGYVTKRTQGPLWTLECVKSNVDASGNPATGGSGANVNSDGLQVIWEIQPQVAEKELLESTTVPIVRGLPYSYKKYLKDLWNKNDNVDKKFVPYADTTITATQHTYAQNVWNLMLHGATTVDINYPIVRRTITPDINYSLTGYSNNTNRIFRWSSLVATESIPYNYAEVMPATMYPDYTDTVTIDGLIFQYGYKKSPLTVSQISTTKNQVIQDWTFGLWSTIIYGVAI